MYNTSIPYFSPHVWYPCWPSTHCPHTSVCVIGQKHKLENNHSDFLVDHVMELQNHSLP